MIYLTYQVYGRNQQTKTMDTITLANWLKNFQAPDLPKWDDFPDFDLYMDQLVSLGNRYLDNLIDTPITSSMVNSYVKKGLMERPIKKKYHPEHVAELIVISLLKNVYSLEIIKKSIKEVVAQSNVKEAYDYFATIFNTTLAHIRQQEENILQANHSDSVINFTEQFAVRAVIYKLISSRLIELQHHQHQQEA